MMELSACGLCQLQVPSSSTTSADLPIYHTPSDSLKLTPKRLCKPCHILVIQIEQFATHHQIKYCDPNFKSVDGLKGLLPQPRQPVQQLYASSLSNQRTRSNSDTKNKLHKRFPSQQVLEGEVEEPIHPYVALIVEELKSKNLLCLSQLPRTLQLLVHLSCRGAVVSAQQRRQKVKNILMFLAERINLSLQQLPYVLVLANFLLCFMDTPKATAVVVQLSDILIAYPHLITWKTLIVEQDKPVSKSPLSPASLDLRAVMLRVQKLWVRVQAIVELGRRGEAVLHEGMVRLGKLDIVEYKEFRKRLGEVLKPLLAKREEKEDLSVERLGLLYLMKLERNGYSLILKSMIETEDEIKQELMHMSAKHKKEKDEYVDKIVRLSNKIEELQHKIVDLTSSKKEEVDFIIQGQVQKQIYHEPVNIVESDINNSPEQIALQSILSLTNLASFNQKYLGSQINIQLQQNLQVLTKAIVTEIQRLQQGYQKLCARVKHAQQQKHRLLGIVSRKDDRFISVITQKDIIIQRYQQALWRMENGLQVEQQPLAHRIRYIIHIFSKRRAAELVGHEQGKGQGKECRIY